MSLLPYQNTGTFTQDETRTQQNLVRDVAEFLRTVLDLKCNDTLTDVSKTKSFLDLVIIDGEATFGQTHGRSPSLSERRQSDEKRRMLQSAIDELCQFCERYHVLLNELSHSYCDGRFSVESVDLCPVVACSDFPSGGYFIRTSLLKAIFSSMGNDIEEIIQCIPHNELPDDVEIGGFAIELARLLEDPVEKWIIACESNIEALVPARDDEFEVQSRNVFRKRSLRRRLVKLLCQHISMLNLFKSSTHGHSIILERQPSPLNTAVMEKLISDYADDETVEECELLREHSVESLRLLQSLCLTSDIEALAEFVKQQHTRLLDTLRFPPSVLTRRPGYSVCDFRLHTLRSIVLNTTRSTHALIIRQLEEWRSSVGIAGLGQLSRFLEQAIDVLQRQKFPGNGFLATLRLVKPPPPTWKDGRESSDVYLYSRSFIPILNAANTDLTMQMPASTEQLLRLISMVWEILAYPTTRDFYFTPGRVSANFLREVVSLEKVSVVYAAMHLRSWKQKCDLGRNFRSASNTIVQFRGGCIENHIRESFAKLSKWSLKDILSIVSEQFSPTFHSTQWKLVDAVDSMLLQNNPRWQSSSCCGLIGRVLDVVQPLVIALRSDVGVRSFARPHQLSDLLRAIPAIRSWDGKSQELVLTTEDVAACKSDRIKKLLHQLSDQNSVVHYGRARKALGMGAKRVFTFNGHDLNTVLFAEVL